MGPRHFISCLFTGVFFIGCCKDKPSGSSSLAEDKAFSTFALKVQRQLERATDPTAVNDNSLNAEQLSRSVGMLQQQRQLHQEHIARADHAFASNADLVTERIALIRIDRQLELVDRLLKRYEDNAPAVADGH